MGKVLFKILLVVLFVVLLTFGAQIIFQILYPFPKQVKYGITFSQKYAQQLNLNWKSIYIQMFKDLKIKNLRLPTYWDITEPSDGKYDFSDTDFMLAQAKKNDAKVILTLGQRQYRYPECYIPDWARSLDKSSRRQKLLQYISKVVNRYKNDSTITAWEVENEPLLTAFESDCGKPDSSFLGQEVELVRKLDSRPIILTDSGELGLWIIPMRLSNVFGTTLYRTVYNQYLGLMDYPILPYFYNLKSSLVRFFFAPANKKTIILELQTEPWSPNDDLQSTKISTQQALFPVQKLKSNIEYAKATGFDEIYLWGVEWWYFMKEKGDSSYLNYIKTVF